MNTSIARKTAVSLIAFGVLLLAARLGHAAGYAITTLPSPSATQRVEVFEINNAGQVAAGFRDRDSVSGSEQAFVWQGGSHKLLSGPAGALGATALGVANSGVVVGTYYTTLICDGLGNLTPGDERGFVLDPGVYSTVELPGYRYTQLRGVSPDGRYVSGYASANDGASPGFLLDRVSGTFTTLSIATNSLTVPQGISGNGLVVGSDIVTYRRAGFVYNPATGARIVTQIPGYTSTAFRDIDESGNRVGWLASNDAGGTQRRIGFIGTPSA